jgi:linker histone H1 and H5 family
MSYYEKLTDAILALKERNGSSSAAIKKYIEANNKGLDFQQHQLRAALKRGVESGKLVQVKMSYKIAPTEKANLVKSKKSAGKTAAAKPAAKAKTGTKATKAKATPVKKVNGSSYMTYLSVADSLFFLSALYVLNLNLSNSAKHIGGHAFSALLHAAAYTAAHY